MQPWCLADILHSTGGILLQGDASQDVQGVRTDSRTVRSGELFIALRGERFDGHAFVAGAVERGATALLIADPALLPTPLQASDGRGPAIIRVPDTERALQDLALAHRRRFPGTLVAITGSYGKTTVKELTAAVLQTHLTTFKAPGNLNNHVGVPLALLDMDLTQQVAVFEMGMNHLGEIRRLCEIAQPHMGVITNIGLAHVGYLGSAERIQQAKGELIEALDTSSTAIVNADDPRALALGQRAPGRVLTFGQGAHADIRGMVRQNLGFQGVACTMYLDHMAWDITLPLLGTHNLMNALAAAAVGVALGVPAEGIVQGVQTYRGMYGRMVLRHGPDAVKLLDDTYNASPHSMQAALQFLAHLPVKGQRIAVLADMLELGETAPQLHQEVGALVAHSAVHHLIVFGPLAQHIASGARQAGMAPRCIHTATSHQDILTLLTPLLGPHDVVLLKGSRGMAMERLVEALAVDEGTH
jgi:UDP-N-acetylmuramoyl-tripeptide--D-alanyl-D-alanine ligase